MPDPRSTGFPRGGERAWWFGAHLARVTLRPWFPLSCSGHEHVPDGPMVVAANHFSHLDPVMVGAVIGRPIRYLAVDELYGNSAFFDHLTTWLGAIPMSRTRVPLGALRLALAELSEGGGVGLFPEGVRVWRWGEVEPKRGAAWLAARAGVPLVPVAISGTDQAMGRGTARISRKPIVAEACEPIHPVDFSGADDPVGAMTDLWKQRIDGVLGGVYGL